VPCPNGSCAASPPRGALVVACAFVLLNVAARYAEGHA
jgi:hypothetical protein